IERCSVKSNTGKIQAEAALQKHDKSKHVDRLQPSTEHQRVGVSDGAQVTLLAQHLLYKCSNLLLATHKLPISRRTDTPRNADTAPRWRRPFRTRSKYRKIQRRKPEPPGVRATIFDSREAVVGGPVKSILSG